MSEAKDNTEALTQPQECDAVVVGAGFSGLYAHYRLRELNLTVRGFETGAAVGGTWYWNRYPGARVDGPSLQYSYSFSEELQQEWEWPEAYSAQPELERYINHVADRFDLRRDIQFETTVTAATYDERIKRWMIETNRGDRVSARYLVAASGVLSASNVPAFKGLDSFGGEHYHTSRWPKEGVDLQGKRVGVIGTGSTGIQIIPMLAQEAKQLFVFQRTPHFSLPSDNGPMDPEFEREWKEHYDEHREAQRVSYGGNDVPAFPNRSALSVSAEERQAVFESAWGDFTALLRCFNDILTNPEANDLVAEFVRNKIRATVSDPEVAELLAPKDYPIGTKRICIDSKYFETYNRSNVTLVDVKRNPIEEITPTGLRTAASEYELDVLIFATGFDAMTGPLTRMGIVGKGGVTLTEKWQDGPLTYLGVMTAGFPNLFTITGPGSPSVAVTMTMSIEQHVDWVVDLIRYMEDHGIATVDADADAEAEWANEVRRIADSTLFPRANSWYMGANIPGKPRVFMIYAGGLGAFRQKCEYVASHGYIGLTFDNGEQSGAVTETGQTEAVVIGA